MSKRITPNNPRFTEVLAGLLHELLKAAGTMVPVKGQERIREVGKKLAQTIEYHAERKSVEVAKLLQAAVKKAFIALEKDVADNKAEIDQLKKDLQEARAQCADNYRTGAVKGQKY